ncbi:hypothetical protein FXO37_18718 [Capsicum annuum]|nr:hypothetical protein FXO37_18718 [Capsicum annuum]
MLGCFPPYLNVMLSSLTALYLSVPFVSVKQCYKFKAFESIGYVLVDYSCVPKLEECSVVTPSSPKSKVSSSLKEGSPSFDVSLRLTDIDSKLDAIKDLLLATHFQPNKIKDVTKKAKTNVAWLRVRLDQVLKEVTKITTKIQTIMGTLSATISTRFSNMKDVITQTLAYLFYHFEHPLVLFLYYLFRL